MAAILIFKIRGSFCKPWRNEIQLSYKDWNTPRFTFFYIYFLRSPHGCAPPVRSATGDGGTTTHEREYL